MQSILSTLCTKFLHLPTQPFYSLKGGQPTFLWKCIPLGDLGVARVMSKNFLHTLLGHHRTKNLMWCCFILLFGQAINAQQDQWPVLKTYDQNHLQRIAMPVGGFGTGTVSLKGNGAIQDWEIMNRPAKGFNPWLFKGPPVQRSPFFALYIKEEKEREREKGKRERERQRPGKG